MRNISEKNRCRVLSREGAEIQFNLLVKVVLDYAIFAIDNDGIILSWNVGAEAVEKEMKLCER